MDALVLAHTQRRGVNETDAGAFSQKYLLDKDSERYDRLILQLCHTIYANGKQTIDLEEAKLACNQLMQQGEAIYLQYRQMLTDKQWDYLIAIAKEETAHQITASAFLKRHKIGTPQYLDGLLMHCV